LERVTVLWDGGALSALFAIRALNVDVGNTGAFGVFREEFVIGFGEFRDDVPCVKETRKVAKTAE